jgi:hypothetical protein
MCLPFITKTLVESQPVWRDINKSQTYVRVLLNNLFYIEKKPLGILLEFIIIFSDRPVDVTYQKLRGK